MGEAYRGVVQLKKVNWRTDRGVILPLLAIILSGLLGLGFILMLDNFLISRGAVTLRQGLASACRTLASRAFLQSSIVRSQDLFTMTESHLGVGSGITITSGVLYIPTMPDSFKRPRSVPDVSAENLAFPNRIAIHKYPTGRADKCSGTQNADCIYLPGPRGTFSEPFFETAFDSYYDAGSYIGCRITAEIDTWWPREEPATITATIAYSSRLRNFDPRILKSNVRAGMPSIVIAVSPQIQTLGSLPNPFNLGLGGLDSSIFPIGSLDFTKYPPNSLSSFGNLNLLRPSQLNSSGKIISWPLMSSSTGETSDEIRTKLYSLCASPPVVLRQRFSSSLIELLSRNGITRRSTAVVATNPWGDRNPFASDARETSPPVSIISDNQDLRWREFNMPLMNFSYAPSASSSPNWLHPFATEVSDLNIQKNAMYQSLLARMPALCYHLDSSSSSRKQRLNLPGTIDLSSYPYDNFTFENPNEFTGTSKLTTAPFSEDASYLDLLNMWRQGMVEPLDEDTRTLGSSVTAPGQRMLSAPEILSAFGAHIRCPFKSGTAGFTPCGPGAVPLEPDIASLIDAWRNHTANKVWKAPGLFHDGALTMSNLKPLSPQVRRPAMVLFLHSISPEQLSLIQASGLINENQYNEGPLVIVYIPIGGTPPIGVSWIDTAKAIQSTFEASACQAIANEGAPVEENVIIPLIPLGTEGTISDGDLGCLRELYPCTKAANFDEMWSCFLQDPEELDSIESNVRDKFFAPVLDGPIFESIRRQ